MLLSAPGASPRGWHLVPGFIDSLLFLRIQGAWSGPRHAMAGGQRPTLSTYICCVAVEVGVDAGSPTPPAATPCGAGTTKLLAVQSTTWAASDAVGPTAPHVGTDLFGPRKRCLKEADGGAGLSASAPGRLAECVGEGSRIRISTGAKEGLSPGKLCKLFLYVLRLSTSCASRLSCWPCA